MGPVGERTLGRLAEEAFERHGDHDSVLFEGLWHRSGDLFGRSCRLAAGLAEAGVRPGDRVGVLMTNSPDVGVVYAAVWRAGGVVTPMIFLLPPAEIRRILEDAEASVVVAGPELLPAVMPVERLATIVVAGPAPPVEDPRVVSVAELEEAGPGEIAGRDDSDLAALMYTGGTTGRAKGVMLTHENLWTCGRSAWEASYVPGITRAVVPLPLSHAFGVIATIVGMHNPEPGQGILMRWFDAPGWLRLVEEHRAQRGAVVPSMLQFLLAAPLEEHDLSSLRYVNCGAAPLAREVAEEFERRVPGVEICEGYGCTESGGVVSMNRPGRRKLGSVGPPLPGYEVRIVGEDGREVAPDRVGEVCVRAPGVMRGYWRDAELTGATLRDGWLHTGDLGRTDREGHVWIVDRKKDLIIRSGFNVFPRDVEDALLEHPAVAAAGVVGKPDRDHGEEVVAFVSLRPGREAGPEELVAFARERLGAHRYPREVRIVPSLPLTPVGKVDRRALREELGTNR